MSQITKEFFEGDGKTRIEDNEDTRAVVDFLSQPKNVARMIRASNQGKPALSAVVEELEAKYAEAPLFPLTHAKGKQAANNRRNVGWIIRRIMRLYGYEAQRADYISDRVRIPKAANSKYFYTSAVYAKDPSITPEYKLPDIKWEREAKITVKDLKEAIEAFSLPEDAELPVLFEKYNGEIGQITGLKVENGEKQMLVFCA